MPGNMIRTLTSFSLALLLVAVQLRATVYCLDPNTTAPGNGSDWDHPWSGYGGGNIANVHAGDTVYFAKGSFGNLIPQFSGGPGARIRFLRATVADHGPSTGWVNSMDGPGVANVSYGANFSFIRINNLDYITFDGRGNFKVNLPATGAGGFRTTGYYGGGTSNELAGTEFVGPGAASGNYSVIAGDNNAFGRHSFFWLHDCVFHDSTVSLLAQDTDNMLIENNDFGVVWGSGTFHDNSVLYSGLADHGVIRLNYYHDNAAVSMYIGAQGPPGPDDVYVYGNVVIGSRQWLNFDAGDSNGVLPWQMSSHYYVYNNTVVNGTYFVRNESRWPGTFSSSTTGGDIKNNIIWNTAGFYPGAMTHDYNYSSGTLSEVNGIQNMAFPPFVNLTSGDLHIVGNTGATYPRGKGVFVGTYTSPDKDGNNRANPPSMGAYEFGSAVLPAGDMSFSVATQTIGQHAGTLTVTVNRNNGNAGAASVLVTTSDGTAHAGHDYVSTTKTLTWTDGTQGSRSFQVPILNTTDTSVSNRTFTLALSSAAGATIVSPSTQTITINMDPIPVTPPTVLYGTVGFQQNSYTVAETGTKVTIGVTRSGSTNSAAQVAYATSNASAVAGFDYTAKSGTLTWSTNSNTTQTFDVLIANTGSYGPARNFVINLANVSGSSQLTPQQTAVSITMSVPITVTSQVTIGRVIIGGASTTIGSQ